MTGLYKAINSALICCAVAATLWMVHTLQRGLERTARPVPGQSIPQTGGGAAADHSSGIQGPGTGDGAATSPDGDRASVLWTKNLFSPTRREGVDIESDHPAIGGPSGDMELIGIGSVDGRSAAVIIIHGRGGRHGKTADAKRVRHVYTPGDTIEGTGYVLDKVSLHEAVLTKGADERILRFETADTASQKRSADAAREKSKPVPPPAAPSAGTAGKHPGTSRLAPSDGGAESKEMERRERLKKALDARRKILELRRGNSQKTGDVQ